jgi:soluble lytic murein transglycosylase
VSSAVTPPDTTKRSPLKWVILIAGLGLLLILAVYGYWYYRTHRFDKLIIAESSEQGLDPRLVKSLIAEESSFNPNAHSSADARGLMQVTPILIREWTLRKGYTEEHQAFAKEFAKRIAEAHLSADQIIYDPQINVKIGCWYLHYLLNKYESQSLQIPLALAAYNAGPSKAEGWLHHAHIGAPLSDAVDADEYLNRIEYPETRDYIRNIVNRYASYKRANSGL